MKLGSGVAVVSAGGYSSDLTPSLETSVGVALGKKKKRNSNTILWLPDIQGLRNQAALLKSILGILGSRFEKLGTCHHLAEQK